MEIKRHTIIPAALLIIIVDGKVALLKRINTPHYDGFYGLPSGHVEQGELPTDAIIREAKEEINIEIKKEDLEPVFTLYRRGIHEPDYALVFFKVNTWSGEIINNERERCSELLWCDINHLPENIVPYVKSSIEAIQRGEIFGEVIQ